MKFNVLVFFACAVSASLMIPLLSHGAERSPTEAGRIKWHRDFTAAKKLVAAEKPMMLLFQEIPG